jgi:hypothetical protein
MKPLLVVTLFALTAGCGGLFELRVPVRTASAPAAQPAAAARPAAVAPAPVAAAPDPAREEARRLQAEEQARRQQAAAEEQARRKQAEEEARKQAEAKAKVPQKLRVAELGVEVTVPGDVEYKPHHSPAYGDPALLLSGPVSHFSLILTNAGSDRYGLDDRIRKQRSQFTYGIDVVRKKQRGDGSWEFEYSTPTYFNDGKRAWDEVGVFARRVVAGKRYNCLIAGLSSQKALDEAVKACLSIKPAR